MNTTLTRREMLGKLAAALPVLVAAPSLCSAESRAQKRMGVCAYSYSLHWKAVRDGQTDVRFKYTLDFLDHCNGLGAGGDQIAVGSRDPGYASKARARTKPHPMYFDGQ